MRFPHHRHDVHRVEQPRLKPIVTRLYMRKVHLASFQPPGEVRTTIFDEMNIHAWIAAVKTSDEVCEPFDDMRCRANPQRSRLPAPERARSLSERLGVGQQAAAAHQQVLALRRELNPPADAIEQADAQLCFQCLDLPRRGRLREIEPRCGAREPANFRDGNEGPQVAKVHRNAFQNVI